MNIKRIIFIRPGETDWNVQDRWQGWVAAPLNVHGHKQALVLAGFLRNIGVGAMYSSDLRRAADTAAIIAERLGSATVFDARLRERKIGEWQGLTAEEVALWYPDEYAQWQADPENYVIPGGESIGQVKARMQAAFNDIVAQDAAETVGVVSHTVTIRALLDALVSNYGARDVRLGNTAVSTIMREHDAWKLVVSNDVMHLEGLQSRSVRELEDKR